MSRTQDAMLQRGTAGRALSVHGSAVLGCPSAEFNASARITPWYQKQQVGFLR